MPEPRDKALYEKIKKKLYRDNPKHSAYRSATLVKLYKQAYAKTSKSKAGFSDAYIGKKPKNTGIKRWMKEEWKNQRGEIGYKYKSDIYRPTKRVTAKTPKTFKELKPKTIKRARRLKAKRGRTVFS